jgi:hypothetical protein
VIFNGSFVSARGIKSGIEVSLDDKIFSLDVFKARKTPARRSFNRGIEILKTNFRYDSENNLSFYLSKDESELFLRKLRKLDRRVSAIINAPLSTRSVETLLNISAEECRRWTKTGKLPCTAKITSARTENVFSVNVFSPSMIQNLLSNPKIITEWRLHEIDHSVGEGE